MGGTPKLPVFLLPAKWTLFRKIFIYWPVSTEIYENNSSNLQENIIGC